ncbi:MAG: helix-turn-helix transcriptional regulator [Gemmatimonadaceae bacterium]|nr:helix-turn-helix transcriptional regulator [Gemmatimonadaceae bacterium]
MPSIDAIQIVVRDSPVFVRHELTRMGRGWFAVSEGDNMYLSTIALVVYVRATTYLPFQGGTGSDTRSLSAVPLLQVGCVEGRVNSYGLRVATSYNLSDGLDRFAFLARLAQLAASREPRAASREPRAASRETVGGATGIDSWLCQIQDGFDLHVRVDELAARINVNESTISRWCKASCQEGPEQILRRRRAVFALQHMISSGSTLSETSRALGFSGASNLSRVIRGAFGCSIEDAIAILRRERES